MTNISLPELPLPVLANNQTHQCWFTAEQMMDFAKDAVRIYRLTSTNNTSKQAAGEAVGYVHVHETGYDTVLLQQVAALAQGKHYFYFTPPRHPADEGRDFCGIKVVQNDAMPANSFAIVTDEMVERAAKAYTAWFGTIAQGINTLALRAALNAALQAGTP